MVVGAMTDPKGDRSKSPVDQADPDQYVHVADRRDDGVVVRGAKLHMTGAVNSHEILVMPTAAMDERSKDYAINRKPGWGSVAEPIVIWMISSWLSASNRDTEVASMSRNRFTCSIT